MYTLKQALYDIWQQRPIKGKKIKEFFEKAEDKSEEFMSYMTDPKVNYFYIHWKTLSARNYKKHFKTMIVICLKNNIFDAFKEYTPQIIAHEIVDIQSISRPFGSIFTIKPNFKEWQ